MTLDSTFRTSAIAMLLLLTTTMTHASEWSGHVGGLVGLKTMDDSDWPDLNTHFSMGVIFDITKDSWPIGISLDLMDTGDKNERDGLEDLGHTTELHLGVRKLFMKTHPKIHPYVGGGVAFMSAEQEYQVDANSAMKQDDTDVGGWVGGGTYFSIVPRFALGLDVRYSRGKVNLFDKERDAGGIHTYITATFQF